MAPNGAHAQPKLHFAYEMVASNHHLDYIEA